MCTIYNKIVIPGLFTVFNSSNSALVKTTYSPPYRKEFLISIGSRIWSVSYFTYQFHRLLHVYTSKITTQRQRVVDFTSFSCSSLEQNNLGAVIFFSMIILYLYTQQWINRDSRLCIIIIVYPRMPIVKLGAIWKGSRNSDLVVVWKVLILSNSSSNLPVQDKTFVLNSSSSSFVSSNVTISYFTGLVLQWSDLIYKHTL